MIDLEKVKIAKEWMNALANGYNPLDGTALDDKDIVNNVHISRCLFYVWEELDSEAVLILFDKFVKHDLYECNLYHSFCSFSKEFVIDGQPSEVFQP